MRVLPLLISLILVISCFVATFASSASASSPTAEIKVKTGYDSAIEQRMEKSRKITLKDLQEMPIKDVREHLTWRGEPCLDCEKLDQLRQALSDHIEAGTHVSAKQYSETSAQLRSMRSRQSLGDNPHGNQPHEQLSQFESRRRRHEDPSDPHSGFKKVLGAHGYDTNDHPFSNSHSGQKEVHSFLAQHRERARRHDPGRRDPGAEMNNGDL